MSISSINVLALGDVVSKPGRQALKDHLSAIKKQFKIDCTIVNAENACGGLGLDAKHAYEIRDCGVDVITLGDHTWAKKEITEVFKEDPSWIIRPYNYPQGAPGRGHTTVKLANGCSVNVANLLGRVFMEGLWDCPFAAADKIVSELEAKSKVTVFDFHTEATSEKIAFGFHMDGRCSLVFGTHTHVQTADEKILPLGSGYITDLGMCGVDTGVIGMDASVALYRFKTGRPKYYETAKGEGVLSGVVCTIDCNTGKAIKIERLKYSQQL